MSDSDFLLQSYLFDLPRERIAQHPAAERAASRLMVLDRAGGAARVSYFADILKHLPPRCLLVANNSRVIPARVSGRRAGGGKAEALLLTPPPLLKLIPGAGRLFTGWKRAEAEALLRPAKKLRPGELISVGDEMIVEVLEHGPYGRCKVQLAWQGDLWDLLEQHGSMPLPPYIKRGGGDAGGAWGSDAERYQTAYARMDKSGSVAAPTAGLHFSPELLEALGRSGREWAELTLYVGYGTFSPVRGKDIRNHAMHAEYVEIPAATARAVARAREEGRPVIAVGTTSARALEGAFAAQHPECAAAREAAGRAAAPPLAPFAGWVDIFLYPGKPFNVIDGLLTNFHLPGSSLLMLVAALAGRERVLAAYQEAVARDFRFFSYGDAMLIV